MSSSQKRPDQPTVTSIYWQGHWFQQIWRSPSNYFQMREFLAYIEDKFTLNQWSNAVFIHTPAAYIWGTQQKDAVKCFKKSLIAAEQQSDTALATGRVTLLFSCIHLIYVLSYSVLQGLFVFFFWIGTAVVGMKEAILHWMIIYANDIFLLILKKKIRYFLYLNSFSCQLILISIQK